MNTEPIKTNFVSKVKEKFLWSIHRCKKSEAAHTFCTFLLIFAPAVLLNVKTLPWYGKVFGSVISSIIITISALLQIFVLYFLIRTSLSNPGIVAKGNRPELVFDPNTQMIRQHGPPKYQNVIYHGQMLKLKYCHTCYIYKCPRTVHCSICNNCVEKFDHHCPWVGNCIGRRNYRSFYLFVSFLSALTLLVMSLSIAKLTLILKNKDEDLSDTIFNSSISNFWDSCTLTVYTIVVVWFVMGLCVYHTYLVSTNKLTYEQIKGYYNLKPNPWNRGMICNVYTSLCQVLPEPDEPYPIYNSADNPPQNVSFSKYSDSKLFETSDYNNLSSNLS